ncbi:unnamed protein product, partial [Amoebophrya sp. A25]
GGPRGKNTTASRSSWGDQEFFDVMNYTKWRILTTPPGQFGDKNITAAGLSFKATLLSSLAEVLAAYTTSQAGKLTSSSTESELGIMRAAIRDQIRILKPETTKTDIWEESRRHLRLNYRLATPLQWLFFPEEHEHESDDVFSYYKHECVLTHGVIEQLHAQREQEAILLQK